MIHPHELAARDDRLTRRLRALGVTAGATVYTATDLTRLPMPDLERQILRRLSPRERQDLWLDWVYESIRAAVGPAGTLVVPTFFYDYARYNRPFVYEESPSQVCNFSEHIRRKPGACRSLHPLFSLTALGPAAEAICGATGHSAYGECSAFARLAPRGALFAFLGATLGDALTYAHHLEQLYGVNHAFNKVFEAPVYRGGREIPGPWYAFVRYLGMNIEIDLHPFETYLRDRGLLRIDATERGEIQVIEAATVHREGLDCLARDACFFLQRPVRVHFKQDNLVIRDTQPDAFLVGLLSEDPKSHVSE
ncbi:MAG: AAC(3) family N-acetyltransferase [Myxococcales bacterium]|nr:AAC(3) family N-acetyltransferase [Myxococcales bacterium]